MFMKFSQFDDFQPHVFLPCQVSPTSIFSSNVGTKRLKVNWWMALQFPKLDIAHKNRTLVNQIDSWWLNQPIWNILVKLDHETPSKGKNKKHI